MHFLLCLLMSCSASLWAQEINLDKIEILVDGSSTAYLGEQYKATISLNQALPESYEMIVTVNGRSLRAQNNKAVYTANAVAVGEKTYSIKVTLKGAEDGLQVLTKKESYWVRLPAVTVVGDKMNVFFVGVDNPITVTTPDISPEAMKVSIRGGGELRKTNKNQYVATFEKPGLVKVRVENKENLKTYYFDFRVKNIPNPVVKLGKRGSCTLSAKELQETLAMYQKTPALGAWLENFDFEARCQVTGFTFLHYDKKRKKQELANKGATLEASIITSLKKAKSGDVFIFTNIKGTCPMDKEDRELSSLVIQIK